MDILANLPGVSFAIQHPWWTLLLDGLFLYIVYRTYGRAREFFRQQRLERRFRRAT